MLNSIVANLIAGLGLLFNGLRLLMEKMRQECLADQQAVSAADRAVLLQATGNSNVSSG